MKVLRKILIVGAMMGWVSPAIADPPDTRPQEYIEQYLNKRNSELRKQRRHLNQMQRLEQEIREENKGRRQYFKLRWWRKYNCWWPLYNSDLAKRSAPMGPGGLIQSSLGNTA